MPKNTIILHLDWKAFLDVLPDEDLGQWTRAIMHYMETGEPPREMSKAVEVAFYASFERIGRDLVKYEKKCSNLKQYQEGKTDSHRKAPNRGVSDTESECDPVPVPEPVPEPVLSSSSDDNGAGAPAGMTMTTAELLKFSTEAFEGSRVHITQSLTEAVSALGPELMEAVLKKCAASGGRSWAYVEAAVKNCIATNVTTVEEYDRRHQVETGRRVDRLTPSGDDFLLRRNRPLRLKREE